MSRAKPPKDPRGGHARLYWSILDSPAWRALTHADVRVYLALRRKLGRTNNGDINATLAEMRHAGISSSSTLSAALHRLEALGFIEKTRQGGIANGGKLCSLYRFTDEETYEIAKAGVRAGPATNEWKQFKNMAEARAAVRLFTRQNRSKVRPSTRSGAAIESERPVCASTIERVADSAARPSKRRRASQNALQAA
jgi:predicted transcriptional regulator